MKTYITYIAMFILITAASVINAKSFKTNSNKILVETQLLNNLNSNIEGLKVNSIQVLGEIKSEKSVLSLMESLKSDKSESIRISSAQSLYKIGDARGIYAIQQSAKFDDSKRVREVCKNIYNETLKK